MLWLFVHLWSTYIVIIFNVGVTWFLRWRTNHLELPKPSFWRHSQFCNEILWQLSTRYSIFTRISQHSFQPDESGIQLRYNIWATTLDNLINQGQVKVTLGKHDLAVFATWVVTKIWIHEFPCFLRIRNLFLAFFYAAIFGWLRKSRSTSDTGGTQRYWLLHLVNFWNFSNIYVFEVNKSISDIPKQIPCSSDLKNIGQLSVSEVLRGTDDCALRNFIRRPRNLLHAFQLSYFVWVISKTSRTGHWPRFRGHPNKVSQ